MSYLLTSFSWTYALLQVPSGWLCRAVWTPQNALLGESAVVAPDCLDAGGVGLRILIVIRGLLGAGKSADWPSSVVALKRWFPRAERAKANSILLGGLYLGPIAAAPITTLVILQFGWRWAFYGLASLAC
jgi:ACS family glucarate transporter-like MFS transporter